MLKSISWQEFLTVMSILSVIYYSVLGLIYYRAEIRNFLSGRTRVKASPPSNSTKRSSSLIGQIKEEEEIDEDEEQGTVSSDQIHPVESSPQDALLGVVADLLKGLKEIIDSIAANKTEKTECLVLIKAIFSKYSQLGGTKYQQSINLFLYENAVDQFPFELPLEEINSLWSR
jgi:hypothetical protein